MNSPFPHSEIGTSSSIGCFSNVEPSSLSLKSQRPGLFEVKLSQGWSLVVAVGDMRALLQTMRKGGGDKPRHGPGRRVPIELRGCDALGDFSRVHKGLIQAEVDARVAPSDFGGDRPSDRQPVAEDGRRRDLQFGPHLLSSSHRPQ